MSYRANTRKLQALVIIQRLLDELGGGLHEEHFAILTDQADRGTDFQEATQSERSRTPLYTP
jgi:hypothetical protein